MFTPGRYLTSPRDLCDENHFQGVLNKHPKSECGSCFDPKYVKMDAKIDAKTDAEQILKNEATRGLLEARGNWGYSVLGTFLPR